MRITSSSNVCNPNIEFVGKIVSITSNHLPHSRPHRFFVE